MTTLRPAILTYPQISAERALMHALDELERTIREAEGVGLHVRLNTTETQQRQSVVLTLSLCGQCPHDD